MTIPSLLFLFSLSLLDVMCCSTYSQRPSTYRTFYRTFLLNYEYFAIVFIVLKYKKKVMQVNGSGTKKNKRFTANRKTIKKINRAKHLELWGALNIV